MNKLGISEAEWRTEIDKLRVSRSNRIWTKKEDEILLFARNDGYPVSWNKLVKYWKEHFMPTAEKTLKKRYEKLMEEKNKK